MTTIIESGYLPNICSCGVYHCDRHQAMQDFSDKVDKLMSRGYVPIGGPFTIRCYNSLLQFFTQKTLWFGYNDEKTYGTNKIRGLKS